MCCRYPLADGQARPAEAEPARNGETERERERWREREMGRESLATVPVG